MLYRNSNRRMSYGYQNGFCIEYLGTQPEEDADYYQKPATILYELVPFSGRIRGTMYSHGSNAIEPKKMSVKVGSKKFCFSVGLDREHNRIYIDRNAVHKAKINLFMLKLTDLNTSFSEESNKKMKSKNRYVH